MSFLSHKYICVCLKYGPQERPRWRSSASRRSKRRPTAGTTVTPRSRTAKMPASRLSSPSPTQAAHKAASTSGVRPASLCLPHRRLPGLPAQGQCLLEKTPYRAALTEHPFGTLKLWFGWTHFLVRGLTKVGRELGLMGLCSTSGRWCVRSALRSSPAGAGRGRRHEDEKGAPLSTKDALWRLWTGKPRRPDDAIGSKLGSAAENPSTHAIPKPCRAAL